MQDPLQPELFEDPLVRKIEALLFAAASPLSVADLERRLPTGGNILAGLERLRALYAGRGVELDRVGDRYRFRTAPDLCDLMQENREVVRRLSKAALETLAIIAYHQPVTRAEIEQIRGVGLSKGTLDLLLEMGFVRLRGRRKVPGRPVTYGTSDLFLEHFSLAGLADLPGLSEMKAAGLLDMTMPVDFVIPVPNAHSQADADEIPHPEDDDGPEFSRDYLAPDEDA